MRFQTAGLRPVALWSAMVVALALPVGALLAQSTPAAAQSAAVPADAGAAAATAATAVATADHPGAALKPGDAAAGQGKAAVCGACHGMDGNAIDAQYPKLAGQSEEYIALQLADFKSGVRENPIMMGMSAPLSPQDMRDLGAYFASQKVTPGVADEALVAHGQSLFRDGDAARGIPACMACHGPDGRGNPGSMYPQLAGQHAQYLEATLKAWHDGVAWGTSVHAQIMPTIAKRLDAQDITALSSYIEGLHNTQPATTTALP